MSLVNFTLPYGPGSGTSYYTRSSPLPELPSHAAINSMLYEPSDHQQPSTATDPRSYVNDPYAPPQNLKSNQQRPAKSYLPTGSRQHLQSNRPAPIYGNRGHARYQQQQQNQQPLHLPQQHLNHNQEPPMLHHAHNQEHQVHQHNQQQQKPFQPAHDQQGYDENQYTRERNSQQAEWPSQQNSGYNDEQEAPIRQDNIRDPVPSDVPPDRPTGFTRVDGFSDPSQAGQAGAKTRVHAVLDYDDEFGDYYDDADPSKRTDSSGKPISQVTPIQGPIFIKNGSVPVVPLYSYPVLNNGTFVQIPILWTALSLALGIEIRGDVIRGVPCVKRFHQLFCPTAGNSYPIDRIESFIDENKALMKRMYGDFQNSGEYGPPQRAGKKKRAAETSKPGHNSTEATSGEGPPGPDPVNEGSGDSYFSNLRNTRQSFRGTTKPKDSGRVDACESKVEIVTPYWASNSAGKIRAIVNTQHFEQAIHQEVCSKVQTNRCAGDCGCEQKYKWHRLLAYDPDNDCKGIFMDWFLFPSCCVCRCAP